MLHILNAEERNQAFVKFMFLFLFTLVFCGVAVYFNVRMPIKANSVLSNRLEDFQFQEAMHQKFTAIADTTKNLIESLGNPGANNSYLKGEIQVKLDEMAKDDQHKVIHMAFSKYYEVKVRLLDLKDTPTQMQELVARYTEKLRKCEAERDQAKHDLEFYRKF